MKLLVSLDQRFSRTADGAVWTDGQCPYRFWLRYLEVFDAVRVVARVREVPAVQQGWLRADGPQVGFDGVPYYLGPKQYLRVRRRVRRAVRQAVRRDAAVMLRVGSQIANVMRPMLLKAGQPFGVEVVGDPYDVFARQAVRHPLRPLFRWHFTVRQQQLCRQAATAAYVTREYLQRRYPPAARAFSTYYSDVELPPESFAAAPRTVGCQATVKLITVGSLAQRYKGIDVLIDAVDQILKQGVDVDLSIAGDGAFRGELQRQAAGLGRLGKQIHFLGQLPGSQAVRVALNAADVFVLPSRVEGLPRALLEAMAAGLPCIGTRVGGMPELLEDDFLAPAGDAGQLADKLRHTVCDRGRMQSLSLRNLRTARQYSEAAVHARRLEHYQRLCQITQEWQFEQAQRLAAASGATT